MEIKKNIITLEEIDLIIGGGGGGELESSDISIRVINSESDLDSVDITAESRPQIPTRDHVIFSNEHRRCKGR